MEKPKSCTSADRNPRCKLCTRRRKGDRCEYLPAKKRSAAEEEFSACSMDPERNIVNAKRKNRKVDRFNPGQSSLRNKATGKRNYAPFRQLSHGPLDLRGIIEKNEHVAAILSTLQCENDKLSRKLRETQSLLNKKERAQVIEKGSSKQTTLLHFFRPKAAGGGTFKCWQNQRKTGSGS